MAHAANGNHDNASFVRPGNFQTPLEPLPEIQTINSEKLKPYPVAPPSPIITRRTRRESLSERAAQGPVHIGHVKWFCRQRGHGFITPKDGGDDLFVHISDIDGEFVPHEHDDVSYKLCPCPPKFEKMQAVHVTIRNLAPGVRHERWDQPPSPHKHPHPDPNIPEVRDPDPEHLNDDLHIQHDHHHHGDCHHK